MTSFEIGRDFGLDAYEVMEWPLNKFYDYLAYYVTKSEEFKKKQKKDYRIPHNELVKRMTNMGFLKKNG